MRSDDTIPGLISRFSFSFHGYFPLISLPAKPPFSRGQDQRFPWVSVLGERHRRCGAVHPRHRTHGRDATTTGVAVSIGTIITAAQSLSAGDERADPSPLRNPRS
jgi:hypothetical protein